MGKPRQTRSDVWKKRPCVVKYREWADKLRAGALGFRLPMNPIEVKWEAYIEMPKSWSNKKKEEMSGAPHRSKPDRDNIDKAICDALFREDKGIAFGEQKKYWDDGKGPRIELEVS